MDLNHAKQELIEVAKVFYDKNWMLGTSGNLSICLSKEPLEYVITASGYDKGQLTEDAFVVLNDGLTPAFENQQKPSAETALHEAIYQIYPDSFATYHVHTVAATVLSQYANAGKSQIVFENLEMMKGLGCKTHETQLILPIIDNTQDIKALASELEKYLISETPAFLLRGHGLYTWGNSPFEAKQRVECWEFLFQVKLANK